MLSSWRDFPHCKVTVVRSRVEEILRRVSGPLVLEVGCNEGWVSKAISEERGFSVVSVDNSDRAIADSKEFFGIDVVKADVRSLPFEDASFDCVVGGEILEHLDNPGAGLAEMFRVSRGHVILTVPIGKYWNDERTHAWQLNGGMVEHDSGEVMKFFKHAFVVEFRRIRLAGEGGSYVDVSPYHEDR